ncbi:MAG: class I SAM-dependent methyltransferase [Prolixibacteraceae bacterium]|nr:class I SAM-dependent methyltransferase [Prolixibacteraceae bacterium]
MTTILTRMYIKIGTLIPGFRKVSRKWMYQAMGRFIKQDEWTYMNYGYADLNGSKNLTVLDKTDEENRLSYQLYNHLTAEIELEDKHILEVGSGRGGGASMIKKYHKPEKLVGLDFSGEAVKLCNRNLSASGLDFIEGDAENMPFSAGSFDVVINVESSHCYYSMNSFLNEVNKVLKSGGHFLFTDFRKHNEIEELENLISSSGLEVLEKRDITPNVIKALDEDHDRRMRIISQNVPKPFIKQFREFAGVKNSIVYNQFEKGELRYMSYIMRKAN